MRTYDVVRLSLRSILAHKARSFLTALGIAIGIAAVVLLTSIGEGVRRFVLAEFTQFGTTIVAINPGKATTHGTPLGIFGSARPLTLADAAALERAPYVRASVPAVWGNAEVEAGGRRRRTTVYGTGPDMPEAFSFRVAHGRFLPHDDAQAPRALAVLGAKLRRELFGNGPVLGRRLRIGGQRYRVLGTMEPKGQFLGFDLDDSVFIPAARALALFDRDGLMEIDVLYEREAPLEEVLAGLRRILVARHGQEDFTITTQQQMLEVLGNVLDVLTFAVGALGGISLVVGAVGILTIMTIGVRERTAEIGTLRALGARRAQVLWLFLSEAAVIGALGGIGGLALGVGGAQALRIFARALPVHTPVEYVAAAEAIAIAIGLLAGAAPARRASRLQPVEALRAE
ncbi:MAG: ABC transporter permease [Candidatus Dadabacteria bacterium]|nr:MAG: ABC transporter permease [Candidatus Dadabacteria bacterium]